MNELDWLFERLRQHVQSAARTQQTEAGVLRYVDAAETELRNLLSGRIEGYEEIGSGSGNRGVLHRL